MIIILYNLLKGKRKKISKEIIINIRKIYFLYKEDVIYIYIYIDLVSINYIYFRDIILNALFMYNLIIINEILFLNNYLDLIK